MRPGSPFKFRTQSNPYVGMLTTPDVVKYKIPIPFAFVPPNPLYNPRENAHIQPAKLVNLASAADFQNNSHCQKSVQNYNKCIKNNKANAADVCTYYLNYLSLNCKN